jgi:transposase
MESQNMRGFTLIIYNAALHKIVAVRGVVSNSGNILKYLPPYSPQLNPIEELFQSAKRD